MVDRSSAMSMYVDKLWQFVAVALIAIALTAASLCAVAKDAAPAGDDQLERRVNTLSEQLRCLVCQNQTIADSHADLAIDLKNQIRDKMKQGQSDAEITAYMVARYGDFVLYRPPLKMTTLLLWAGPFVLMIAGIVLLIFKLRGRRGERAAPLTDDEHARAAALLTGDRGERQ